MAFNVSQLKDPLLEEFLQSEKTTWILDLRKSAFQELLQSDFPNPSMEMWRKISLSNFDPLNFSFYRDEKKNFPIPKNVSVKDFRDVSGNSLEILIKFLQTLLEKSKGDFFQNFNFAFFTFGVFVEIEESCKVEEPILIRYELPQNQNCMLPFIVIVSGKNSEAQIVEEIIAKKNEDTIYINSFTSVFQEESSRLTYVTKENFSDSVLHFRNLHTTGKKDSTLKNFYFNMGGYKGKTIIESNLVEKGSNVETYGATLLANREFLDTDIQIIHGAGNTESKLLMKVVAKDKSHNVFTGNLNIPKSSEKVIATQLSKNLILNKTARAEAIPKLEVFAHDVRCSHGASVGEIREEEMFYLLSRGLTEEEARFLVVEGFLCEILDKLPDSERGSIQTYINEKLFQNGKIY